MLRKIKADNFPIQTIEMSILLLNRDKTSQQKELQTLHYLATTGSRDLMMLSQEKHYWN